VVIASLCEDARSELLKRACDSVQAAARGQDYSILIVANGSRVSPKVLDWLSQRADCRIVRLRTGSHPLARRVGAELANSEFLAFLDDDDELVPDSFAAKIAYFRRHPDVDVLVTDGLRVNGSMSSPIFPGPEARGPDLVETLMRAGWGASALTLRARNIDLAVFDTNIRHMEWTLTTLELARRHKVGFLDERTYRYYEDTPNSVSKSIEHALAMPEVWRRLSEGYAGTPYDAVVRRRYGTACHYVSWECVRQGKMRDAWRLHAESLRSPGGMAFVPFSVKLAFASLRRLLA
jgi:hypothetical protein